MVVIQYDETMSYRTPIWTVVRLEHQQFVTYMLEKQAVMDMPVRRILKLAVRLEH